MNIDQASAESVDNTAACDGVNRDADIDLNAIEQGAVQLDCRQCCPSCFGHVINTWVWHVVREEPFLLLSRATVEIAAMVRCLPATGILINGFIAFASG